WSSRRVDRTITRILDAKLDEQVRNRADVLLAALKARLINQQSRSRARLVGLTHYDLGNDLYAQMLDKRLVYTCAYWRGIKKDDANALDAAQEAKLDLVCRKLGLKQGMTVLDIGCGWGSFAIYAAQQYGVQV